jgi:hypothetical protein
MQPSGDRTLAVLQFDLKKVQRMKTLLLSIIVLGALCCSLSQPAFAGTDSWGPVGPNCVGVQNTAQHICEFIRTQLRIGQSGDPFDQWNLITVEPGVVTDVTCQIAQGATSIFQYMGALGNKANPWKGSHYGNVAICRGWINGGNGPVTMTVTYQ